MVVKYFFSVMVFLALYLGLAQSLLLFEVNQRPLSVVEAGVVFVPLFISMIGLLRKETRE